jgi:Glycosyl transferases group 1/Glycosyl transferase 4-like
MRILFVAFSESVHTARWISQIADQGWDLHLFPSVDSGIIHPELRNITVHVPLYGRRGFADSVRARGVGVRSDFLAHGISFTASKLPLYRRWQVHRLASLIRRIQPDIVQSLEIQNAGYLTMETRRQFSASFPRWIVTNWGSDIYYFGRQPSHRSRIAEVLAHCDYYSCECERDVGLARELGLRGRVLPVLPNGGGFDLEALSRLRSRQPTSARRLVMMKGYQSFAGRALVALSALERCVDVLRGYELVIYSATQDVAEAAQRFAHSSGIRTTVLPVRTAHARILEHHGRARISIGVGITDGISTSLLEAMAMGSFPIQSRTACADEWIEDGKTGLLTGAEDPQEIAAAIRRALTDDALVDAAAEGNWRTAAQRLERQSIQTKVVDLYDRVLRNDT